MTYQPLFLCLLHFPSHSCKGLLISHASTHWYQHNKFIWNNHKSSWRFLISFINAPWERQAVFLENDKNPTNCNTAKISQLIIIHFFVGLMSPQFHVGRTATLTTWLAIETNRIHRFQIEMASNVRDDEYFRMTDGAPVLLSLTVYYAISFRWQHLTDEHSRPKRWWSPGPMEDRPSWKGEIENKRYKMHFDCCSADTLWI